MAHPPAFTPDLWSDSIAKTFHRNTVLGALINKPSELETMVMRILTQKAKDEGIPVADFEMLNFRVQVEHDIASLMHKYSISWQHRDDAFLKRGFSLMLEDHHAAQRIGDFVEQIKIRGELYFFKLHKHFPKKLKQVHTQRDGKVTVEFVNGQIVEGHESQLDDREFLSKCVMVHDL